MEILIIYNLGNNEMVFLNGSHAVLVLLKVGTFAQSTPRIDKLQPHP
jgi:hypothetical protein